MLYNIVTVRVKKIERLFVTDPLRVIFTPVKNSLLDAACGLVRSFYIDLTKASC